MFVWSPAIAVSITKGNSQIFNETVWQKYQTCWIRIYEWEMSVYPTIAPSFGALAELRNSNYV